MRTHAPLALLLASCAAALAVPSARRAAAEETAYAKHLEEKAAPIVAVKLVVKMGERERNLTEPGVMVDPVGVVMVRSGAVRPVDFRGQKTAVSNLRVVFPGDEKEYDAIVGATDTRLGLGFVRIRDLAGKAVTAVDLTTGVDVKLGDELFGVTRLEQGFDYAPLFGTARVAGQVTKPRSMWIVTGFLPGHHFLYAPDGRPAGVLITQSGVTEGDERSGARTFLLPMKAAVPTIKQGIDAAAKALAEDAERAKEDEPAAEKPAETTPSPTPANPESPDAPK